jgi:L-aspartate oxidase
LVFGVLAAETMAEEAPAQQTKLTVVPPAAAASSTPEAAVERWIADLRGLMWKHAGLLRDGKGLREAQRGLDALAVSMPRGLFRRALEARNLHVLAGLIVASALGREESRGAHYRNDFPLHSAVARHSVMQEGRLKFVA